MLLLKKRKIKTFWFCYIWWLWCNW